MSRARDGDGAGDGAGDGDGADDVAGDGTTAIAAPAAAEAPLRPGCCCCRRPPDLLLVRGDRRDVLGAADGDGTRQRR